MDNIIDASRVFRMITKGEITECMGKPSCVIGNPYVDSLLSEDFQEQYAGEYSNVIGILDYWEDSPTPIETHNDGQIVVGCLKEM